MHGYPESAIPPEGKENARRSRAAPCDRLSVRYMLKRMVQFLNARLNASFAALSDATRRGVLDQLGRADASITDLAEKFHMTLTGMKKHVGILEELKRKEKGDGRKTRE